MKTFVQLLVLQLKTASAFETCEGSPNDFVFDFDPLFESKFQDVNAQVFHERNEKGKRNYIRVTADCGQVPSEQSAWEPDLKGET